MKNLKLFWQPYQNSDLKYFKSLNNTWNNILDNSQFDHQIYMDSLSVPDNSSLFLVEPKSIHPGHYQYALDNAERLKYIISYDREFFNNKINNFIHIPPPFGAWINDNDRKIYDKNLNISFIASTKILCEEHKYRQQIVNKLSNICDVYGKGRREIKNKIDGLRNYRFSVCMENYITDLYYTEKILDCFLTGTIPIYWGTKNIKNVFDINGIIFLDDLLNEKITFNELNEQLYNEKLTSINNNFKIANNLKNNVSNSIDTFIEKIGL
jgi:hypothetical protein